MEVKQSSLAAIGTNFSHYPTDGKTEIAFAGKSNVGKSTLINAMLGRKALARTSSQPGKTRTINFYDVNDAMYVVDLPGYGYAKAPKTEIAKWGAMIEEYLEKREYEIEVYLYLNDRKTDEEYAKEISDIMQEIVKSDLNFDISVYVNDEDLIFYSLPDQHIKPDIEVILEEMDDVKSRIRFPEFFLGVSYIDSSHSDSIA